MSSYDPATSNLDEVTLKAAQDWLRERVYGKGSDCPCCRQFAKVYKRPLTSSMAYALILIDRHFRTETDWLHIPTYLSQVVKTKNAATVRGGDWAKMTHFGLIEEMPESARPEGSKRTGFYRITDLGKKFVRGQAQAPAYVLIYNSRLMTRAKETVTIQEALGTKFSYEDLMKGAAK